MVICRFWPATDVSTSDALVVAARRVKTGAEASHTFRALLIELPIYAVLVVIYFFAVLHFLANWLGDLKANHNTVYALVSIALIIGQAVVLEWVTTMLLRLFRGRSE
jgi:hypothetical protein